jgi:hypothetical protein
MAGQGGWAGMLSGVWGSVVFVGVEWIPVASTVFAMNVYKYI